MERTEILEKLTSVIRDVFKNDKIVVNEETELQSIDGWDSLLNMQLIVTTEKCFGIRFKLAELNRLTSVSNIMDLVQSKL